MTAKLTLPNSTSVMNSFELDHYVCLGCNEDLALCGEDMTDAGWVDEGDDSADDCIVCFDLSEIPCQRCGS